jgi:hypothetical protein
MGQLGVRCPYRQLSVASVSVSCGKLNREDLVCILNLGPAPTIEVEAPIVACSQLTLTTSTDNCFLQGS